MVNSNQMDENHTTVDIQLILKNLTNWPIWTTSWNLFLTCYSWISIGSTWFHSWLSTQHLLFIQDLIETRRVSSSQEIHKSHICKVKVLIRQTASISYHHTINKILVLETAEKNNRSSAFPRLRARFSHSHTCAFVTSFALSNHQTNNTHIPSAE